MYKSANNRPSRLKSGVIKSRIIKSMILKPRIMSVLLVGLVISLCSGSVSAQEVSPELFSGLSWRLIGPFRGGRTVAVAGVPGGSKIFYFGAVDGGIWKTTDAGTVWLPIFDSEPVASIGAIEVAPSDANIIYAGTGESDIRSDLASGDGVYKSTDAGKTWRNIGLKDSRQISRIVIDPKNPEIVNVGVHGHAYGPNEERGVYKSSDGGITWKHTLYKGPDIGVSDLAIAAENSQVLFAGTWNARRPPWSSYGPIAGPGSGLYRSSDGGENWVQLTGHGLPDGDWGRVGVAVSADGRRAYALIDAKAPGLYRSDDGGNTWILENSDPRLTSRSWYFNSVTIDPTNSDVLYVPNIALYRSDDGGKTISVLRGAPGGDDYHQLWVDPRDSSTLLLASDQGTSLSLNDGKTWSTWYNQPTAQFYHVVTDNQFPYMLYGAQQDSGSVAIPSRTDHSQITSRDWIATSAAEGGYFAVDPNDPNILYDSDAYGAVERYDRRTSLSQNIAPWPVVPLASEPSSLPWSSVAGGSIADRRYRAPWTPVLVFSPVDKKTLYLGTQYVMTTIDGGMHWQQISPDLTGAVAAKMKMPGTASVADAKERGYGVIFSIAPSPLKQNQVWAGSDTGLIHITLDGGKKWANVTPEALGPWSNVSMIEASHFDPAEAYAAIDRHEVDDYRPCIYRTRDFGKSWQRIDSGIASSAYLRAIREDPKKKGLLFAGTELGVYASFDDGDHWQPLQLNLPVTSVRDLQVHDDDLVIATHGRSFWILDDIEPLREIRSAMNCPGACLFRPAAAIRVDNNSFAGTPLPPEEPAGKNPPDGAIFDYFLPAQASEVTLTIFDRHRQVVRRFSSTDKEAGKQSHAAVAERWFPKPQLIENTAGMHRFVWDLRWRYSGNSAADNESGSAAPKGPRVPPGSYEVKLTVDGRSFIQPVTVRMDPRSSASVVVLDEQFRLSEEILDHSLQSRAAVAEIDSVRGELADLKTNQMAEHPDLLNQVLDLEALMQHIWVGVGDGDKSSDINGLISANAGLDAALNAVEGGNRAVPPQVLLLYRQSRKESEKQIAAWTAAKKVDLTILNVALQKAGLAPIAISEIEEEIQVYRAW
jgi:photosystem II stability/assembly factor-like uncharacterized protein